MLLSVSHIYSINVFNRFLLDHGAEDLFDNSLKTDKKTEESKDEDKDEDEDEDEDEEKVIERHACFKAATFNIKGPRSGSDVNTAFLSRILNKLSCDAYFLQECPYKEGSDLWSAFLFHEFTIKELGTFTKDAAIAWNNTTLQKDECSSLILPLILPLDGTRLKDRVAVAILSVKDTKELVKKRDGSTEERSSSAKLKCLLFSFHGWYRCNDNQKMKDILFFFKYVRNCCRAAQLPAIVGGDFNFDLRKFASKATESGKKRLRKLVNTICSTVVGRRSESEIDYFCTVCSNEFPTKLMLEQVQTYDLHSIATESKTSKGEPIKTDEITNHWPYTARIRLWMKPQ